MKRLSIFFLFLLALTELLSEELDVEGIKSRAEAGNDQSQLVLASMFDQGVGELDQEKLPQLLELKYHAITDAVNELGSVASIRNLFVGFQEHLYSKETVA